LAEYCPLTDRQMSVYTLNPQYVPRQVFVPYIPQPAPEIVRAQTPPPELSQEVTGPWAVDQADTQVCFIFVDP
jgi:hypothetical protein